MDAVLPAELFRLGPCLRFLQDRYDLLSEYRFVI